MTRMGKCDICRIRKVKCDEQRPKCGQCMKKNRPCQYEYIRTPKFVDERQRRGVGAAVNTEWDEELGSQCPIENQSHGEPWRDLASPKRTMLSIRSMKTAKYGDGAFHTFTPVRLSKRTSSNRKNNGPNSASSNADLSSLQIGRLPCSPAASLSARFIKMIGPQPMQWNPSFLWGAWVGMVPSRIGVNAALDAASECFISGTAAYRSMSDSSIAVARKQYSQAIRSVQGILDGPDENLRLSSETLTSVKLLLAFETLLGYRGFKWIPHGRGLVSLLVARGPGADTDDLSRSLFYASLAHDFTNAVRDGTDSAFDTPEWLYFAPPDYPGECPAFETAYKVIMQQMIRIPRLMRLVREFRANSSNVELGLVARKLAEKLYLSNLDSVINGVVGEYVAWEPTVDAELARYFPESMEFATVSTFEALLRYCYCRILILGLCKVLREIGLFSSVLEMTPMASEEIRNASLIAMSVQYAEKQRDPVPTGSLMALQALQVAYGTWWRVQREEVSENSDADWEWEKERAWSMKMWCLRKRNEFLTTWGGAESSLTKTEVLTSALEGGPLMQWMQRKFKDDWD